MASYLIAKLSGLSFERLTFLIHLSLLVGDVLITR